MKLIQNSHVPEWNGKFNWVDDFNVVVGFDSEQSCCESFGYEYALSVTAGWDDQVTLKDHPDISAYRFDPTFYHEYGPSKKDDGLQAVAFRMVADDKPELFLILVNSHNGYYSHGFEISVDGKSVRDGSL